MKQPAAHIVRKRDRFVNKVPTGFLDVACFAERVEAAEGVGGGQHGAVC